METGSNIAEEHSHGNPAAAADDPRSAAALIGRQAEVLAALASVLPPEALLYRHEDTVAYECDGLTAYRQAPLLVALPRDRAAGRRACCRSAMRWRCRSSRAAPAPGCRAAPCRIAPA